MISCRVVARSNNSTNTNGGVGYVNTNNDSSNTNANIGSRLTYQKNKTRIRAMSIAGRDPF